MVLAPDVRRGDARGARPVASRPWSSGAALSGKRGPMKYVHFAAALGVSMAGLVGCGGDRCASTDLDCFLRHMVLVASADGSSPRVLVDVVRPTLPSTVCSAMICGTRCTNVTVDELNCGTCGNACAAGATCLQAVCSCPSGTVVCGTTCSNPRSDPANCGTCGNVCGSGTQCAAGACASSCGEGLTSCDGACVDTASDAQNCGSCGTACGTGQTCQSGTCQCTAPSYACGCVELTTDAANCGGCGIACDAGTPCTNGVCQSGDAVVPPSVSVAPSALSFDDPSALQLLTLSFTDANGCTPAFCAHLCSSGLCSSDFMCTKPKHDRQTQGVFLSYLGFLAEPADQTTTFTADFVAVSAPGCPADLLDRLATGSGLTVGISAEIPLAVTIEAPRSTSGGSGGSPDACSSFTAADCCAGSAGITATSCALDPSCQCPSGTTDGGYFGDGNRNCVCPGG